MKRTLMSLATVLALAAGSVALAPLPAAASDIKAVVNGTAVTSYDIQRRAAFLKLQRRQGSNDEAATEMIDQALRLQEITRLNLKVTDAQVDDAYARFAKNNKMTVDQLGQLLDKAGVTKPHFKEYIRAQMGWNQALSARFNSRGGRPNQRDAVAQMLKKGGSKPSATEYMLQQVIFVVPAAERGAIARRRQEAESLRQRFTSCDSTRQFAKGLVDVTVRDLGRTLEPALPPDWADAVKAAGSGSATPVRETPRGVEFIGVCNTREVSDDRVAQMMVQTDGGAAGKGKAEELSNQYMDDLRKRAKIVRR